MTPTQAVTLMKIGTKPTTTHRTSPTIIRRAARYFCEIADAIHDERRTLRRQSGE